MTTSAAQRASRAPDLFDALRTSHDAQRALCSALLSSSTSIADRADVFFRLKIELEAHAAAEERYLYVPILMDDAGLSSARHALAEHHEIEELLEDLSVRQKQGAAWVRLAKELDREVRHHLGEEEQKFFKVAGRILSEATKRELAESYTLEMVRMKKALST
ncbi:MAG: hemerythrin domain-containing protein [Myxococcales bacterium]|nr:hemerythrin domain-containing protein [Myxococcales bacterium]